MKTAQSAASTADEALYKLDKKGSPAARRKQRKQKVIIDCLVKGVTVTNSCKAAGVGRCTFYYWLEKDPLFFEAVCKTDDGRNEAVESAFFRRAIGYKYNEVHQERYLPFIIIKKKLKNGKFKEVKQPDETKAEMVVTKIIEKDVAPSESAAFNWLKNKRPDEWKEKSEVDVPSINKMLDKIRKDYE